MTPVIHERERLRETKRQTEKERDRQIERYKEAFIYFNFSPVERLADILLMV